jgi:hypothetical protein
MSDPRLAAILEVVQEDAGNRGLRTDPADNLITRTAGDFEAACRSLAETKPASLAIVTGFWIATAQPPAHETDGPLGALFLARALVPLGIRVALLTDHPCELALKAGLEAASSTTGAVVSPSSVPVKLLETPTIPSKYWRMVLWADFLREWHLTHLVTLERVGPSHMDDRCYSMRGRDITEATSPAHVLFEDTSTWMPMLTTIGIGDGGNEIGMGKIPREVIARNIPGGDKISCRVTTDHLIVAGVSNWGAYALGAAVRYLLGAPADRTLFDPDEERRLLEVMVERGPLVDGVTGRPEGTVDGLPFERHAEVLRKIAAILP